MCIRDRALAELMVPLIGSLYRDGVNIMIYGKSLVNESPVAIMKAHRFARQADSNELSESETYPMIEYLSSLNLIDCEIHCHIFRNIYSIDNVCIMIRSKYEDIIHSFQHAN